MKSLIELTKLIRQKPVAIIASGPSLDLCFDIVEHHIKKNTIFLLSDSVAYDFIRSFQKAKAIVFSVEHRRHNYLKFLQDLPIAFYVGANQLNLPRVSNDQVYRFHLRGENVDNSEEVVSPGTVWGVALAWAMKYSSEITILGADLAYIDNRVYSRLIQKYPQQDYFQRRETLEYVGILQRAAHAWVKQGYLIKTSDEFKRAKKNVEIMISSSKKRSLIDYSPLGLNPSYIEKRTPNLNA